MNDTIATLMREADPAVTPVEQPVSAEAEQLLRVILAEPRPAQPARSRRPRLVPILIAGVAAAGLIAGAVALIDMRPQSGIEADWPWYEGEAALLDRADAVVLGDVIASEPRTLQGIDDTVITVRIEASAKGPYTAGDVVEMKFPAWTDPAPLGSAVGERGVYFVATYADSPASLLSPGQGAYLVTDSGAVESREDNPIRLSAALLAALGL